MGAHRECGKAIYETRTRLLPVPIGTKTVVDMLYQDLRAFSNVVSDSEKQ
jgi:hypothetical protein